MATYPYQQNDFVDKSLSMRLQIIETIAKLRRGESFQAFKDKFIMDAEVTLTDDDLKKLYIDYNFMDSVIKKVVSYCPNLDKVKTQNNEKRKLIKKALREINWKNIENENYDSLESTGDTFLEIYFDDDKDKIPKLRVLDSANMKRALMDGYNRYESYIYKEWVEDLEPSYTDDGVKSISQRERVIVFQKGRKVIYDPLLNEDGSIKKDSKGNYEYERIEIPNRKSYKNSFPLLHIKGYKKQREEFSDIPAEHYIDPSLTLAQITSDLRQINRMLGYPFIMIIDGVPKVGHKRSPAAIMGVTSDSEDGKQAQIKDIQISNSLNSIFEELKIVRDDLYEKAGLITPTLKEKLNIDSSRVVQQLNLPSENKIELYVDNIIHEMELYFEILLKENNLWEEEDEGLSFQKPKFIIKNSPFDQLLYEQSEIKSGRKSLQEIYVENMELDEEINSRKTQINDEYLATNKDIGIEDSVVDRVSNGQNVDKNMIQG